MNYRKVDGLPTSTSKCEAVWPRWQSLVPKRLRTVDCVFIGYANNNSAYRFLVHRSENPNMHVNTIIESKNASFFKHIFPCKEIEETSSNKRTFDTSMGSSEDHNDNESNEPRCSKRARISKSFDLDFLTYLSENKP